MEIHNHDEFTRGKFNFIIGSLCLHIEASAKAVSSLIAANYYGAETYSDVDDIIEPLLQDTMKICNMLLRISESDDDWE